MSRSILVLLLSLAATGCFFGGENDESTETGIEPVDKGPQGAARLIKPGEYAGDYSWIDSNRQGLESEFILNADGTYHQFWISENEAVYDQRGSWHQQDSNFYFQGAKEAWVSQGVLADYVDLEDDTNAVRNVTDTTFTRREWTPLRQKPYWITYHRLAGPPMPGNGIYYLERTYGSDSDSVVYGYRLGLHGDDFTLAITEDSLDYLEFAAKVQRLGSFLATEQNQERETTDSTRQFGPWQPFDGAIFSRIRSVSDTAFDMWTTEFRDWGHYRKLPE